MELSPFSTPSRDARPSGDSLLVVPSLPSPGSRRCSTRILSVNVRETLRQLRRQEHHNRVNNVMQRNVEQFQKQQRCECITMVTLLSLFSMFSFYIVMAHGYSFGQKENFELVEVMKPRVVVQEGGNITLMCQGDHYWEWCRWIHYARFCDFEWISGDSGVKRLDCSYSSKRVALAGDYEQFQCGLSIANVDVRDRGLWQCEVEKYYPGFSRRYGELRTSAFMVVVLRDDDSLRPTARPQVKNPVVNASTTEAIADEEEDYGNATATTLSPVQAEKEYQKKFLMLKIFVLGGVGLVLFVLTSLFWAYFYYLWKTWDMNKRDAYAQRDSYCSDVLDLGMLPPPALTGGGGGLLKVPGSSDDSRPYSQTLLQSRRKSVSFAVCNMYNEETMCFDIQHKSVLLSGGGGANGGGGLSVPLRKIRLDSDGPPNRILGLKKVVSRAFHRRPRAEDIKEEELKEISGLIDEATVRVNVHDTAEDSQDDDDETMM